MNKIKNELNLIFELSHTYRDVLFREFENSFTIPAKLNRTHLKTLMYIRFENNPKMSTISSKMGLEKGSFTPVAQKLLKLGYIQKNKTDKDRRKSLLSLSKKGEELTQAYGEAHIEFYNSKLAKLDENENKEFNSALKTIYNTLLKLQD